MRGNLYQQDIEDIFDDLNDIIEEAIESGEIKDGIVTLVLSGSAPLIYNYWIPFGTDDIDYVKCNSDWLRQYLPQYNINPKVLAYGDCVAYNYEDRLQELYKAKHLEVLTLSLEDLLFTKLIRWSPNDIQDIGNIVTEYYELVNFDLLEYLIYDSLESRGAGMTDNTYNGLLAVYENDFLVRLETGNWSTND